MDSCLPSVTELSLRSFFKRRLDLVKPCIGQSASRRKVFSAPLVQDLSGTDRVKKKVPKCMDET